MEKEKSCGIIVFNNDRVLIIKNKNGKHYGFPKGHVEKGETELETAVREVKEETNIDAEIIGDFRKVITIRPRENVLKDVVFFVGIAKTTDARRQVTEIAKVGFFDVDTAFNLITYENERNVFEQALQYYRNYKKDI